MWIGSIWEEIVLLGGPLYIFAVQGIHITRGCSVYQLDCPVSFCFYISVALKYIYIINDRSIKCFYSLVWFFWWFRYAWSRINMHKQRLDYIRDMPHYVYSLTAGRTQVGCVESEKLTKKTIPKLIRRIHCWYSGYIIFSKSCHFLYILSSNWATLVQKN